MGTLGGSTPPPDSPPPTGTHPFSDDQMAMFSRLLEELQAAEIEFREKTRCIHIKRLLGGGVTSKTEWVVSPDGTLTRYSGAGEEIVRGDEALEGAFERV